MTEISTAAVVRQIDATIAERDRLWEALRDIAELHFPVKLRGDDRSVCADCGGFYPCPTVALIPDAATVHSDLTVATDCPPDSAEMFEKVLKVAQDWENENRPVLASRGAGVYTGKRNTPEADQ